MSTGASVATAGKGPLEQKMEIARCGPYIQKYKAEKKEDMLERKEARLERKIEKAKAKGNDKKVARLEKKYAKTKFKEYCIGAEKPKKKKDFDLSDVETKDDCCSYLRRTATANTVGVEVAKTGASMAASFGVSGITNKMTETAVKKGAESLVAGAVAEGQPQSWKRKAPKRWPGVPGKRHCPRPGNGSEERTSRWALGLASLRPIRRRVS